MSVQRHSSNDMTGGRKEKFAAEEEIQQHQKGLTVERKNDFETIISKVEKLHGSALKASCGFQLFPPFSTND